MAATRSIWLISFMATLRRRLLDAVACGGRSRKRPAAAARRLKELLVTAEASEADSESGSDDQPAPETKIEEEAYEELLAVAKRLLQGEDEDDKLAAAATEVRRLAKDDAVAREVLGKLGAVDPLVAMLDSGDADLQIASLYALLNLGIGSDSNKAAIVNAGAVDKMLKLAGNEPDSPAVVANLLCLSALDANKTIIGAAAGAIPFLIRTFRSSSSSSTARHDALRAIFNLSISPSNIPILSDHGVAPALITAIISDDGTDIAERALAALCNIVASPEGRRAVSRTTGAIPVLIDALHWTESPECQESAAYVLMVVAHKSSGGGERAAMAEAGIVSSLLELALVGSALAQKRASRLLEILAGGDEGKWVCSPAACSSVSAPIGKDSGGGVEEENMSEDRMAVRELVRQSLQWNMQRIARRANLPAAGEFATSEKLRAMAAASSTSISLPF